MDNSTGIIKSNDSQIGKFDNFTTMEDMTVFANTLIKSNVLPPNYKTTESVIATVIQGKELGLKAMTALQNIHFISGKPTLGINAISALIKSKGVDSQVIKDCEPLLNKEGKVVDYITTIKFYRFSNVLQKVLEESCSFKWSDAAKAGLTTKDPWKKFTKAMMYARCFSMGARRIANDILLGIYETTEIADSTNMTYNVGEENEITIINPITK